MREALKNYAREAAINSIPGLAVTAGERLINSPVMQRWFDKIEKKRKHGMVASFRRFRRWLTGKDETGIKLSAQEREELEQILQKAANKYRK